jgi:hypothetical protein
MAPPSSKISSKRKGRKIYEENMAADTCFLDITGLGLPALH